jgi:hypothetical protein
METNTQIAKKLKEAPIYEQNPFLDNMIGEFRIKNKTQMIKSLDDDISVMLVTNNGENVGHSAFMRQVQVDEDKFAKIYISQLAILWNLQKTSMRVLTYILHALRPNDDRIYFDMKECLKYCNWSVKQSVYNGLIGLINSKIIARTGKSYLFYINPSIVFNGSRVSFMTTYVKKKKNEINPKEKGLENNLDFLK